VGEKRKKKRRRKRRRIVVHLGSSVRVRRGNKFLVSIMSLCLTTRA
jgi:hypothetical protein